MSDLGQVHKVLDSGYSNVPMPQDTEKWVVPLSSEIDLTSRRPKYYAPRNPYATPTYYPRSLLSVLSSPALFAKLDVETLFYVFYYLPGTYFQYVSDCLPL
jgi:CCR4-NOT transcription complex subunit 3